MGPDEKRRNPQTSPTLWASWTLFNLTIWVMCSQKWAFRGKDQSKSKKMKRSQNRSVRVSQRLNFPNSPQLQWSRTQSLLKLSQLKKSHLKRLLSNKSNLKSRKLKETKCHKKWTTRPTKLKIFLLKVTQHQSKISPQSLKMKTIQTSHPPP